MFEIVSRDPEAYLQVLQRKLSLGAAFLSPLGDIIPCGSLIGVATEILMSRKTVEQSCRSVDYSLAKTNIWG